MEPHPNSTSSEVKPSDGLQSEIDHLIRIKENDIKRLDSELIIELTRASKLVADGLRDLRLRTAVGESELIPSALALLQSLTELSTHHDTTIVRENIEAVEQLMRVLGNLVHTHDVNRSKALANSASEILCDLLKLSYFSASSLLGPNSELQSQCLRIILTAYFNLCFEYVPAHMSSIEAGVVKPLSRFVELSGQLKCDIPVLAIRLLDELCSTDDGKHLMPAQLAYTLACPLLFAQEQDPKIQLEQAICTSLGDVILISCSLLESLSDLSEPIQRAIKTTRVSDRNRIQAEDPKKDAPAELQDTLFGRLLCWVRFAELPDDWWELEASDESATSNMNQTKATVARTLISSVGVQSPSTETEFNDAWLVPLLIQWFSDPDLISTRPDMVTTLGLLLGNVACSDESSTQLVHQHHVLIPLVSAFQSWVPSETEGVTAGARPGEQAQVLHSLCGLARNLAVADANKGLLGDSGLMELASECLGSEFDVVEPLIGLALGFLRHVCKLNAANVFRLTMTSDEMMIPIAELVIDVIERIEQPYIRLEAARLLSSAISTLNLNRVDAAPVPSAHPPELLKSTMTVLGQQRVVEAVVGFLTTGALANVLLINEALVALALLAARPESAHPLFDALMRRRKQEKQESEKKVNKGIEVVLACWLGWRKVREVLRTEEEEGEEEEEKQAKEYPLMICKNAKVMLTTLGWTFKGMKGIQEGIEESKVEDLKTLLKVFEKSLDNDNGSKELKDQVLLFGEVLEAWV